MDDYMDHHLVADKHPAVHGSVDFYNFIRQHGIALQNGHINGRFYSELVDCSVRKKKGDEVQAARSGESEGEAKLKLCLLISGETLIKEEPKGIISINVPSLTIMDERPNYQTGSTVETSEHETPPLIGPGSLLPDLAEHPEKNFHPIEKAPSALSPHQPGAKLDDGKSLASLRAKKAHSGNKYKRKIPKDEDGYSDIYDVLYAYGVKSHPRAHAIKKLLCSGVRGKGSEEQDVSEAGDAVKRDLDQIRREAELETTRETDG